MKKIIMTLIFSAMLPVTLSEGQVMPVCSIIEETPPPAVKSIDTELEDYVIGVVAGEMPISFPYEALKAQAVSARTYAVRVKKENPSVSCRDIDQAYITLDRMKKMWGSSFEQNYNKIKSVVQATAGEIMVYDNEPILAVFCSTTNGHTEECENVWTQDIPYLTSVESEGEELSPYYSETKEIKKSRLIELMGGDSLTVSKRTEAGYVTEVKCGNKTYTGEKTRGILGLRSTSFEIEDKGSSVLITTKGYGHGVGMSQYGACYMANNGYSYREILEHYYKGAVIA